ncbi:unnamed protein product [Microthlaspi erraticum]|uniref:Kinesin motor domain-containing protein n=1 Tax=Microthlaspi erraticum TaxID=1685480 RepID=A0A6D2IVK1_9BRAS|nr:unnamed protein product [Microthlaspi erraticum]
MKDLLATEHQKLQIHENVEKGIFVAGLREDIVTSPQQVLEMMEYGESQRHFGVTNMNSYSSRSHTIFRMNLVELAGSERAAKTGAAGVRLKEGSHINKSLMTLGTVIKKLSEGVENQGGHVPYRDSKLTRILQPALAGNANIAIVCNVTLASIHADETKSSLEFASRAMGVTNCAHVNERLADGALLKRQKKEIKELKSKLKASQHDHSEEEILNLHKTLLKDFTLSMRQSFEQHASLLSSYQNVQSCLKQKVLDLENEKLLLQEKCVGLQNELEELNQEAKKQETSLMLQENLKNLEVLAFEMEKKIASLEELVAKHGEKEKALCRNEGLDSEITALTEKLKHSNTQIEHLQKDNTELKMRISGSSSEQQRLEANVKQLLEEKEDLAMRLKNSLLEMEEEKALWRSKENALTKAMAEMTRLYNIQIESLSTEMSEAKKELESCQHECVTLADRLRCSEENAKEENESSMTLEIDSLGDELEKNDGDVEKFKDDKAKEKRNAAPKQTTMKGTESETTDIVYVDVDDDGEKVVLEAVDEEQQFGPEIIYIDDDDDDDYDEDDDDDDEVVEVVAVSSSAEKSVEVVAKWRPHITNR